MRTGLTVTLAIASALVANGADASTNLIANGSFETGNFTGWTPGGNLGFDVYNGSYAGIPGAEDGADWARLIPALADGTLSQTFSDTSGQMLEVSFWFFSSDSTFPNDFAATFDGSTLFSGTTIADTSGWEHFQFSVLGTGSDTLAFSFRNDVGAFGLDNVSVSAVAAPEPAAWALMLAGFAGLGAALRSRPSRQTPSAVV